MTNTELKIIEKLDKLSDRVDKKHKIYERTLSKNKAYEDLIKLVIQNIHPENPILLNIKVRFEEIQEM